MWRIAIGAIVYEVNSTQWKVVARSQERTRTEQILKSEVSSTSSH